jgi:predicted nucleotide-binding protein
VNRQSHAITQTTSIKRPRATLLNSDSPDSVESKWRARQNVILELGWFMAKLGRRRVAILYKGELEIPSDILGIVYHQFSNSIKEVGEDIRQILKTAGIGGTGQIIGKRVG